ncbi:MAG: hypothetical protein AAF619_09555 [Pseudomonadota bacterium]
MQIYFPTVVERDETEIYCAEVVGNAINGQGPTLASALDDAAKSLQEVIWWSVEQGEDVPTPQEPTELEAGRGIVALLQVTVPAQAA